MMLSSTVLTILISFHYSIVKLIVNNNSPHTFDFIFNLITQPQVNNCQLSTSIPTPIMSFPRQDPKNNHNSFGKSLHIHFKTPGTYDIYFNNPNAVNGERRPNIFGYDTGAQTDFQLQMTREQRQAFLTPGPPGYQQQSKSIAHGSPYATTPSTNAVQQAFTASVIGNDELHLSQMSPTMTPEANIGVPPNRRIMF